MALSLPAAPWSTTALDDPASRDRMVQFWLAAPSDQLEVLWASPIGITTQALVRQLTPDTSFTTEQVALRNAVGQHLQAGFQSPLTPQLLLAVFLVSPPGLFKIANAEAQLPHWLAQAYLALYEQPAPPSPAEHQVTPPQQPVAELPRPDFGDFPATLHELSGNRIQLNRMLGLSNLYYIDPDDQEIAQELLRLRYQFVEAVERCPEQDLEKLWSTDLGERYWAMVRSGVQKEPLNQQDEMKKSLATNRLQPSQGGGFGTPGAINALLIAMVYFEPGSMKIDDARSKLPAWLYANFQQIFMEPLQQGAV